MTLIAAELEEAPLDAGADPEKARAAAAAVAPASAVVTEDRLTAALAQLETRLTQRLFAATGFVLTALGIAVGILLAFG